MAIEWTNGWKRTKERGENETMRQGHGRICEIPFLPRRRAKKEEGEQ
jgi:hypothetical protein